MAKSRASVSALPLPKWIRTIGSQRLDAAMPLRPCGRRHIDQHRYASRDARQKIQQVAQALGAELPLIDLAPYPVPDPKRIGRRHGISRVR
jgi:hypothetical protein